MSPNESLHQSRILSLHPFDHPAMVIDRVFEAIFGMNQGRPVSVKIVAEVVDHLDQFLAFGGFVEDVMELGMKLNDLIKVLTIQGLFRFFNLPFKESKPFRADVNGGEVGCIAFEGAPNSKNLLHILPGKFFNSKPSLRKSNHEIVPFKFVKGLPDRGPADPYLVGQCFFDQTLPALSVSHE